MWVFTPCKFKKNFREILIKPLGFQKFEQYAENSSPQIFTFTNYKKKI